MKDDSEAFSHDLNHDIEGEEKIKEDEVNLPHDA
jgi:hypothetical protein